MIFMMAILKVALGYVAVDVAKVVLDEKLKELKERNLREKTQEESSQA